MKLNPDCVRDVLLFIESSDDPYGSAQIVLEDTEGIYDILGHDLPELSKSIFPTLGKYSDDEIIYHIRQCEESGLIGEAHFMGNTIEVEDLTPAGHEFLANIRSDTNWNKTKSIAAKVGSTSLGTIRSIASEVITALIKSQF